MGILANRLDDLARGIAALARNLGDRMDNVVVMTVLEFGRAARDPLFRAAFNEVVRGRTGLAATSRVFPGVHRHSAAGPALRSRPGD